MKSFTNSIGLWIFDRNSGMSDAMASQHVPKGSFELGTLIIDTGFWLLDSVLTIGFQNALLHGQQSCDQIE